MANSSQLTSLPLELQCSILNHLPVATILTFACTSRDNYSLARSVISTLDVAVFSKKIHGLLAFFDVANKFDYQAHNIVHTPKLDWLNIPVKVPSEDVSALNCTRMHRLRRQRSSNRPSRRSSTRLTSSSDVNDSTNRLPQTPSPQVYRTRQIHLQNAHLTTILSTPLLSNLNSLTLHTYALLSPALASILCTNFPRLRHLSLNFSHPAIHDSCLLSHYWSTCADLDKEGSTAWDLFGGVIGHNSNSKPFSSGLTTLQSLSLTRAAISSQQLGNWISRNPQLRDLKLALVPGVDADFVDSLAQLYLSSDSRASTSSSKPPSQHHRKQASARAPLQTLHLESAANLRLSQREDFAWIEPLVAAGLRDLSIKHCANVDMAVLREVYDERRWYADRQRGRWRGLVIPQLRDGKSSDHDEELETRSLNGVTGDGGGKDVSGLGVIEIDPLYVRAVRVEGGGGELLV